MSTQASPKPSNLCQQIYTLMAHQCLDEAAILIEEHLSHEPLSDKGLLAWIRVQCAQGNTDLALERLTSPIKQFPENPYFKLACLEIRLTEQSINGDRLVTLYKKIEQCADKGSTEWRADISAKIGLSAALQNLWSISIPSFLKAIRLYAANNPLNQPENLILLYRRNEPSLEQFLSELGRIDQSIHQQEAQSLSLELLGRIVCVLVTANELAIPEAAPAIHHLATRHDYLQKCNYPDLVNIAIRYSPGWIGIQLPHEFSKPIVVWN